MIERESSQVLIPTTLQTVGDSVSDMLIVEAILAQKKVSVASDIATELCWYCTHH